MRLPLLDDLPDAERVPVRSDLNVPISDGAVVDDQRIVASLPTFRTLIERGFALVVCAHLGRPDGQVDPQYSLVPVAERLDELLDTDVQFGPEEVAGDEAAQRAAALRAGELLLLENLRFDPDEQSCENDFVDAGRCKGGRQARRDGLRRRTPRRGAALEFVAHADLPGLRVLREASR